MKRSGFTLIEALTVVTVFGLIAAVAFYGTAGATKRSRDARRKADLGSIALVFEARKATRTCNSNLDVYPGKTTAALTTWVNLDTITAVDEGCGRLNDFIATVPRDPQAVLSPYKLNLARNPTYAAKHFRLAAFLETGVVCAADAELTQESRIWQNTFQGAPYCNAKTASNQSYNYFIGN